MSGESPPAEETARMMGGEEEEGGSEAVAERGDPAVEGEGPLVRAVILSGFGGPSKLGVSRQTAACPGPGELRILVKACGVGFLDVLVRQGNVDPQPRTPLVPGYECAGVVDALGEGVRDFEVGHRVAAVVNLGAWAEVTVARADHVFRLRDSMSFVEGAALPISYLAAHLMLFDMGGLREGMSVLVHSAGGGVGLAVAQLCASVPRVTLLGTASLAKHDVIRDSFTHVIDRTGDYVQDVKRVCPGGVDIVLDCLCGENTAKGLALLKPMGTYILYGSSNVVTGETKSFFSFAKSWWQVEKVSPVRLYEENKRMGGFQLLPLLFSAEGPARARRAMSEITTLYDSGAVRPRVDSVWALEEVKEAMQKLLDRSNIGRVVLDTEKSPSPQGDRHSPEASEAAEEEDAEGDGEGGAESKERKPFIR
ncbi:synaptic vesicle membrane protein VAT-1 homolog-like [Petromyzon marinus]|uniref:synaptic vesicle membrane protein VAT-1 homolog-like n=1 Tax=Petromyzon marinus TaxID=7757 RepID=UPI003F713369